MIHVLRRRHQSKLLVSQAEELLLGKSRVDYQRRSVLVPPWALVNVLAHSHYDMLMQLAKQTSRAKLGSWSEAVDRLAQELVRMELSGTPVAQLQREALVPLELELLAGTRPAPRAPAQLVAMVHEALNEPRIGR